ncbi:MAG: hypothetical protein QOH70_2495 [Blastocatellia bacterium]|jgi:hypothetical protein|nr:hypothetical protein [Blastocatellia bacterium]
MASAMGLHGETEASPVRGETLRVISRSFRRSAAFSLGCTNTHGSRRGLEISRRSAASIEECADRMTANRRQDACAL